MSILTQGTSLASLFGDGQRPPIKTATRYIFNAGTQVLAPLFSDPSLTVSIENPTVADDSDNFDIVYLIDGTYDVVIKDEKEREIGRFDDVSIRSRLQVRAASVYANLNELINDQLLDYYGSRAGYELQEGDQIRVSEGDFSYSVAAPDATDHHLETKRGIKLYVLPNEGNTWNLAAFGTDMSGMTDETETVQKAMNAAAGGGTLFHPGGKVWCTDVTGLASVTILGNGRSSVFARSGPDGTATGRNIFVWGTGEAYDLFIHGCAFDIVSNKTLTGADLDQGGAGDFLNAIKVDDFIENIESQTPAEAAARKNNVSITDCHFINSNQDTAGNWTLTAITARGINDLIFSRNNCRGVQVKLAGSGIGSHRILCTDNLIHDTQAYAISAVIKDGPSGEHRYLADVTISDNVIYGNGTRSPAIYTGADDGVGADVICRSILISDNQGHMFWDNAISGPNFVFIKHRGGAIGKCANVVIQGNSFTTDDGTPASSSFGIVSGGAGVTIRDNAIKAGLDKAAISAEVNTVITGNTIQGSNRGIEFEITKDGVVTATNNIFDGRGVDQLKILANAGNHSIHLNVSGNTFIDCAVSNGDFQKQPLSFAARNGTVTGAVTENAIIDLGNTSHSIDENNQGSAVFDVLYCNNYFGPRSLAKRLQTPPTNLFGNTGKYHADGPIIGSCDFYGQATFRGQIALRGATEPDTDSRQAFLYLDSSDGTLKVKFQNGMTQTIVTN